VLASNALANDSAVPPYLKARMQEAMERFRITPLPV
jgi:hypothetical protein